MRLALFWLRSRGRRELLRRAPRPRQERAESLKTRLQAVQSQDGSLIAGEAWEPLPPILLNQAVQPLLLKATLHLGKEPNGDEFLVSELWLTVIAQALKT